MNILHWNGVNYGDILKILNYTYLTITYKNKLEDNNMIMLINKIID